MRFFSEATLLKMETSCTRHRKDWEASPSLILTWFYPTLSLKPNEIYTRRSYLRTAFVHTLALTFLVCIIFGGILLVGLLIVHELWPEIFGPKNHAQPAGSLSDFYLLPVMPFIWLLASLAFNWPQYFFWNRRAKRLQREGPISVPIVAAAVVTEDKTIWPPAPRL